MSLALYTSTSPNSKINVYTPFAVTFDGQVGGEQDRLVYLRNDNLLRYYTNVTLTPYDRIGDDMVDGSIADYWWKLMSKDIAPTNTEWQQIDPGNTLSLDDIGDSSFGDTVTYLPIWIRVKIPRGMRIQTITDVVLSIACKEHLI